MKLPWYAAIVLQFVLNLNCIENNVCPSFVDYYTIKNNSKCWYDFSANSKVDEIITKHGYPVETHKATTVDGYILTVFRIPNYTKETSKLTPILLLHGWLNSAALFVGKGKTSLAFNLADAGYDVWLGNFRGTEYSEEHVNLTVFNEQYWDYSVDELALYDIPAQVELIAQNTNQRGNIVLIGHSLGNTAVLAYSTEYPQKAQENFKLFIFLAPYTNGNHMKAAIFKEFGSFFKIILTTAEENSFMRHISHEAVTKNITQLICLKSSPTVMHICAETLNRILAGPQTQTQPNLIPVLFNQMPAGMSFKVGKQIVDFNRNGFGRYDHGVKENIKRYGTASPPHYDVSKNRVPVFIMYAVNDWVCTKEDSILLYNQLSVKTKHGIHEISELNFNHLDFVFGRNAEVLVGKPVLNVLEKINSV